VLHLANDCRAHPLLPWWPTAIVLVSPFWQLLHTSTQLHPDPQTWTSQGLPDHIHPLGPEHCNQTLHSREGSAFLRTGWLCWSLQVPQWLYCPIPDIQFRSHHWQQNIPMTSKCPLLREQLPQSYSLHPFRTCWLGPHWQIVVFLNSRDSSGWLTSQRWLVGCGSLIYLLDLWGAMEVTGGLVNCRPPSGLSPGSEGKWWGTSQPASSLNLPLRS
jgi:hypothetical protein